MLISGIDTETTGLEQEKGHRIIEVAIVHYDAATRKKVDQFEWRIDPQRPIDADAQSVHGISMADLRGMPFWELVAPQVHKQLLRSSLLVAHNMKFDSNFVALEMLRVGIPTPNLDLYCTMENGRWACYDGKLPKLQELCFALGVDYDPSKAHAALYDIERTMECYFAGMERGFYATPAACRPAA